MLNIYYASIISQNISGTLSKQDRVRETFGWVNRTICQSSFFLNGNQKLTRESSVMFDYLKALLAKMQHHSKRPANGLSHWHHQGKISSSLVTIQTPGHEQGKQMISCCFGRNLMLLRKGLMRRNKIFSQNHIYYS